MYDFFIAGKARNKENILKICDIFDKYHISYYCFLKNDNQSYGNSNQTIEEKQLEFESLNLKSKVVLDIFNEDLNAEKTSDCFLLVLPAGNSSHMEAGIAYGFNKRCFAIGKYEATDSLYNIFENIFNNVDELENFLKDYKHEW